jgi:hypothetical protein
MRSIRVLAFALAAFLGTSALLEAAVLQQGGSCKALGSIQSLSSSPTNLVFDSSVTNGNAIVVVVVVGVAASTIGASDGTNGTYVNDSSIGTDSDSAAILSKRNVTGGTITVSVTSSATGNGHFWICEVSGLDNAASPLIGNNDEAATTTHVCSTAGLSGTGIAFCAVEFTTNATTTPGASYTALPASGSTARWGQYSIGVFSANQGPFTTTASIADVAAMAVYVDAAAGGGGTSSKSLLGVGR